MRARIIAIGAGGGAYLIVGVFIAGWLAAAIFQLVNRQLPHGISFDSWLWYWQEYSAIPRQRQYLQFSAGLALLLVFLVPMLAGLRAMHRPRATHGDARFARPREIRKAGLYTRDRGIIVGQHRGRYLVYGGQQFVLLAAPTRSGKGVGVVIPNLLNFPDSAVVLDIKQENWTITSSYRREHGQAVYLFNPFAEDRRTHRWNPFDLVNEDPMLRTGDLLAIGQALYPSDARVDSFWNEQARNLFLGLALYLFETPALPKTFGELLRQSSGKGQPVKTYLQEILAARATGKDALSPTCRDALQRFASTSDNTLSGILATFNAPLTIFANPIVDAATSASDFDIREVRRKRMTIYVGIQPNRLADAALLVNLLFSQLINVNTKTLPENDPTLRFQCLLILDEFTAIGKVGILAKSVAYLAGYNLRLLPIVQSIAQLQSVYGEADARTFVTNHAMQIVFAPREQRDAREYSEMLGFFTETGTSRSVTRPHGLSNNLGSRSENTSEHARALMLPQELKEMDAMQEIIFLESTRPILARKVRYYDDPTFTARLMPAIDVDPLDLEGHQAKVEGRKRALGPNEVVQLERLVMRTALPPLDDSQNPSHASLAQCVQVWHANLTFTPADDEKTASAAGEQAAGQIILDEINRIEVAQVAGIRA